MQNYEVDFNMNGIIINYLADSKLFCVMQVYLLIKNNAKKVFKLYFIFFVQFIIL